MGIKEYSIAFAIAGKVSSDFAKSFKSAGETVKNFEDKFKNLNREMFQASGTLKMRKEVLQASQSFASTKSKVTELGRSFVRQKQLMSKLAEEFQESKRRTEALQAVIRKAKTPTYELSRAFENSRIKTGMLSRALKQAESDTRELELQFNKERGAIKNSEQALISKKLVLQNLEKANKTAGLSTQQLMQREKVLTAEANKARIAQEKLAAINAKSAAWRDRAQNAKGSILSGVGQIGYIASAASSMALPVKQAMQMEDAMAEIKKVVDFKNPTGLKEMEKALERMSLSIPMTADGLAKITAAAGQAGIAEEDLLRFTETAAKMGVAFDISAEEAGEMMAKWRSGMNLTQDQAESLADATNALSNNNAALAKQVGEALKRYGALGKVAGLTEKQTAAMAATIIGAGAEAEVAATGMNAFMRSLTKGGSMTDLQKAAFGNLGFDALQLQKDIQTDAPKTIFAVLDAIKTKLPKELQMQYLTAMFGEEGARAMGPMLANTEKLRENFDLVANSEKFAGSMLNEFRSRSATTSNSLTLMKNSFTYVSRAIGKPMLGPLREFSESMIQTATVAGDWINKNQSLVTMALKVAGALVMVKGSVIAAKMAFSGLMLVVSPFYRSFLLCQKAIVLYRSSAASAAFTTKALGFASFAASNSIAGMKLALNAVGWAMKFMFCNPIGLAIGAVGLLITAGIALYKNWDDVKTYLGSLWTSFNEKFPGMASIVKNMYDSAVNSINGIKTEFKGILTFVTGAFSGDWTKAWDGAKTAFAGCFQALPGFAKGPLNLVISLANKAISGLNSLGSFKIPDMIPGVGGQSVGINIPQIPMLAAGGVATGPSLAMVGEGREPEAILPLSRLGGMMGAGGPSISVNFSPVIQITGAGNAREDVQAGLKAGAADLKRELERLLNSQRRLSYA
nr:MAG TPA: minor tail protein [Caudoviricetes sp.]